MRKSELLNLMEGTKIQHKRNGQVLTVVAVQEDKIVCEERTISVSNCTRWFDILVEEIPEVVEPDNTVLDDIEQADEFTQQEQNTATTDTEELVAVKTFNSNQDTATTGQQDLELDEDLEAILVQLDCTATKRKEYLGIYKEGYRGCVAMLVTSKNGKLHIDMKEKIYRALDEEVRGQIEVLYDTGIYDKTRGYFRIKDCDNLKVLAVVLKTALQLSK